MSGNDSTLVEFSFVSRLADGLPRAALLRLERQAEQFNRENGLTGEMRVAGNVVTQVIEGCRFVLMPLMAHILTDRRHGAISINSFRTIEARRFTGWTTVGLGSPFPDEIVSRTGTDNLRFLPLTAATATPQRSALARLPS